MSQSFEQHPLQSIIFSEDQLISMIKNGETISSEFTDFTVRPAHSNAKSSEIDYEHNYKVLQNALKKGFSTLLDNPKNIRPQYMALMSSDTKNDIQNDPEIQDKLVECICSLLLLNKEAILVALTSLTNHSTRIDVINFCFYLYLTHYSFSNPPQLKKYASIFLEPFETAEASFAIIKGAVQTYEDLIIESLVDMTVLGQDIDFYYGDLIYYLCIIKKEDNAYYLQLTSSKRLGKKTLQSALVEGLRILYERQDDETTEKRINAYLDLLPHV